MFNQVVPSVAALGAAAFSCLATSAQAQPAEAAYYNLPAQELERSVREVAVRSGTNILAPAKLLSGHRAPPLEGRFTPREAIEHLVAGTGLSLESVGDSLVIRRAGPAGGPVSGEAAGEGEVIVTGTHLRGAPPTSPVIVIGREDIDRTGATSVEQLMRTIPQNTQGGVNQENWSAVLPDQDVTDHGAGLNLRGLGQRATLVLVNGRRLAPSGSGSFVDVSLIPVSAIERVEVLTDGASSIYGSDAVGGVVNIILRSDFEGLETAIQAGTTTEGGGGQFQLSQSAGGRWTGGHAMLAYDVRLDDEVRAGDRSFTIGLRPDTFLLPKERRHSLIGTLDQELAPGLGLSVTGTLARRKTERTLFQSVSPLPVGVDAKADSKGLSGTLSYELGAGWRVRIDSNWAVSDTTQRQTQPGGIALLNARDVQNAILEGGVRADGPLFDLPGGPVRIAIGAQARHEKFRDAFNSSTFPEVVKSADRGVQSAFGEILVPLFSKDNRKPGLERLLLSGAVRYDRYGGTGSTVDPKVGLLWSPIAGLDLRGSYSTSFRAPLLSEISGAYTILYLPSLFFYADPTQAPAGEITAFVQGSDPSVQPETSRNWTLGGDWSPAFAPGLLLTFNYYAIRFSDRIALPTSTINVIGNPAFDSIVDLDPDAAAVAALVGGAQAVFDFSGPGFSNGNATPADIDAVVDDRVSNTALTRTRGFDLGVQYAFTAGAGRFALDLNLNHIIAFEDQLTPGSPVLNTLDRPYRPLDWRARGGLSWSRGGWAGSLFVNHSDGYRDDRTAVPLRVSAHTTVDLSLAYQFGRSEGALEGTRIALFAENLFDNDPPRLEPDPGSSTGVGYDPVNASGRGRFVAVQLRRAW